MVLNPVPSHCYGKCLCRCCCRLLLPPISKLGCCCCCYCCVPLLLPLPPCCCCCCCCCCCLYHRFAAFAVCSVCRAMHCPLPTASRSRVPELKKVCTAPYRTKLTSSIALPSDHCSYSSRRTRHCPLPITPLITLAFVITFWLFNRYVDFSQ